MIQTALIRNAHQDLVSDAAYDMYGLYLATCGLDQRFVQQASCRFETFELISALA